CAYYAPQMAAARAAARFVGRVKPIHVNVEHDDATLARCRLDERSLEKILDQHESRQAGSDVMRQRVRKRGLLLALVGNVFAKTCRADHFAGWRTQQRGRQMDS